MLADINTINKYMYIGIYISYASRHKEKYKEERIVMKSRAYCFLSHFSSIIIFQSVNSALIWHTHRIIFVIKDYC